MAVPHNLNSALANMASIFGAVTNVQNVYYEGESTGLEPKFDHSYSTTEIPDAKVIVELIEAGGIADYSVTASTDYSFDVDVRLLYRRSSTKFANNGTTEPEARTILLAILDALRADPQLEDGGTDTCINTTVTNFQPPFDIGKLGMRMFTVRVDIRRDS